MSRAFYTGSSSLKHSEVVNMQNKNKKMECGLSKRSWQVPQYRLKTGRKRNQSNFVMGVKEKVRCNMKQIYNKMQIERIWYLTTSWRFNFKWFCSCKNESLLQRYFLMWPLSKFISFTPYRVWHLWEQRIFLVLQTHLYHFDPNMLVCRMSTKDTINNPIIFVSVSSLILSKL